MRNFKIVTSFNSGSSESVFNHKMCNAWVYFIQINLNLFDWLKNRWIDLLKCNQIFKLINPICNSNQRVILSTPCLQDAKCSIELNGYTTFDWIYSEKKQHSHTTHVNCVYILHMFRKCTVHGAFDDACFMHVLCFPSKTGFHSSSMHNKYTISTHTPMKLYVRVCFHWAHRALEPQKFQHQADFCSFIEPFHFNGHFNCPKCKCDRCEHQF